jgi:hypothetical protein
VTVDHQPAVPFVWYVDAEFGAVDFADLDVAAGGKAQTGQKRESEERCFHGGFSTIQQLVE